MEIQCDFLSGLKKNPKDSHHWTSHLLGVKTCQNPMGFSQISCGTWMFIPPKKGYPLVMTNIAMGNDGPNRNRWFTVLNSMVDLSMANCECHLVITRW